MYRKRLLAAILCATMIFSSGAGTTAFAQEDIAIESVLDASVEDATDLEESESDSDVVIDIQDEEDNTEDVVVEMSEEYEEDISISDASEEVTDEIVDADYQDSADDIDIVDENAEAPEDVYLTADAASPCFEVDEDGVLKLKEGYSIPRVANIPSEAKVIPSDLFADSSVVDTVKFEEDSELVTIESGAFLSSSLKKIYVPKGITEIADDTFNGSELKTIEFEKKDSITSIGKSAFANTKIVSFAELTAVEKIDNGAFRGCSELTYLNISGAKEIGDYAFENCQKLTSRMAFPKTLEKIGKSAFYNCGFKSVDLEVCSKVEIEDNAFKNCEYLTSVILPDELDTIKSGTFYGCVRLTDVRIGSKSRSKTTTIGTSAFGNCASLKSITFYNVKKFESNAMDRCSALETIIIWSRNPEIAEDAFPRKDGVTMKGYSGTTKTYAQKRGYKFELLDEKHPIYVKGADKDKCTVSASANKAIQGTKIKVTVNDKDGYVLKSISIKENEPTKLTLVENTAKSQAFTFIMPDTDVYVEIEMVDAKRIIKDNITYDIEPVEGYSTTKEGSIEHFDVVGRQSMLIVDAGLPESNWLWTFSSSNSSVVSISETGLMTAVGTGEASISATFKADTSKKLSPVKFRVDGKADIGSLELKLDTPSDAGVYTEVINDVPTTIVQYDASSLTAGSKSFDVGVRAYSVDDPNKSQSLIATTNWNSADSSVAVVKSTKSTTNTNKVTVKKNAKGESRITIKALNPGTTTVAATVSFIVRVVDVTPRLENSTITVNSLSTVGTKIDLKPVYGNEIMEDTLELKTKVVVNKVTEYEPISELAINYDGENYYILNATKEGFTKTYSGSKQLYITGSVMGKNGSKESFIIPIKKLTVNKKALNPSISKKGKINLFYKTGDAMERYGEVQITQSIKNVEVTSVKFVSAANHKKSGSEAVDSFANNFDIVQVDDQHFLVRRSSNELKKVNGKVVSSGYIYIKYAGFKDYVKKTITIPTENKAPSLVLSQKSATVNAYGRKQEFRLQLLDKKTKVPVSLENVSKLVYTAETTDYLFENPVIEEDEIVIKVSDAPKKGKAVFIIQQADWSSSLKFTFSVNVTNTLPTVKFADSKAQLNKAFKSQSASLKAVSNQNDTKVVGFSDFVYAGNKKYSADAEKLLDCITVDEKNTDTIIVKLPSEDIAATNYKFKATPSVKFTNNDNSYKLSKQVAFTVTVSQKNATIKLKKSPVSLNATVAGKETVETGLVIGNLPTGFVDFDSISLDDSAVEYVPAKNAPALKDIANVSFAGDSVKVSTTANAMIYGGKSFTYKVRGLKIKAGADEPSTVADFNLVLKFINTDATIKVTQSGSINPIDPTSKMTYTVAISNVVSDVASVKIWEKDEEGVWYGYNPDDRYSEHFEVALDEKNSKVTYLTVKADKFVADNKTYSIKLIYTLAVDEKKTYSADFNIIPKQVVPSIKTDPEEATIYGGQDDRTVKVKISIVPGKTEATTIHAVLLTPEFAEGTSEAIKKAFSIKSFDSETGVMTVELTDPSSISTGTHTLNFVTRYVNQAKDKETNTFSLKVTVKD